MLHAKPLLLFITLRRRIVIVSFMAICTFGILSMWSNNQQHPSKVDMIPRTQPEVVHLAVSIDGESRRVPTGRQFDRCVYQARKRNNIGRCPWPPENVTDLLDPGTNQYDLTLRPWVNEDPESVAMAETYFRKLNAMYTGPEINGSRLRQMVKQEENVLMDPKVQFNYYLYPQVMDVVEAVNAVRRGEPVKQKPINDPVLKAVRTPSGVCDQPLEVDNLDLVFLIKSCASCFTDREYTRKTLMQPVLWQDFRVRFVFVTGLPIHLAGPSIIIEGVTITVDKRVSRVDNQTEKLTSQLLEEADKYQDLLIGNFGDTYYNLTLKMMLTFRWVAAFCGKQSSLYFFIDSDYSVYPPTLIQLIRRLPLEVRPILNLGTEGPARVVLRPITGEKNTYAVSEDEIPWSQYPQYSSGSAYLLGTKLVTDASIAMAFTRHFRVDDAYLGIVWTKLGEQVYKLRQLKHQFQNGDKLTEVISAPRDHLDRHLQRLLNAKSMTMTTTTVSVNGTT